MPNKEQVAAEGISLGEMNRKLLEKVEELTLLLIEKDSEIKKLHGEQADLKQRVERLESNHQ